MLLESFDSEVFEVLAQNDNIRIERIISKGHVSPDEGWYDQIENEWIIVLQGSGTICFDTGFEATLEKGDYINIPSRSKHKVSWTDPDAVTIWLAIFYK